MTKSHSIYLARAAMLTIMVILAILPAAAQNDLAVGSIFDGRYRNKANATETVITGDALKEYKLSTFRSITITGDDTSWKEIEPLVKRDGAKALSKEEKIVNGHLFGAFYELPRHNGRRRYLFYLNRTLKGGERIMIIYLDGKASPSEVRDLL